MQGRLRQQLSTATYVELTLCHRQAISHSQLMGQYATLLLHHKAYFSGYIMAVSSKAQPSQSTPNRLVQYQLQLGDPLSLLALKHATGLFRMQSSEQIMQQLVNEQPLKQHLQFQHRHAPAQIRPWVWQWQEHQLALLQRLWQAEHWHCYARQHTQLTASGSKHYATDYVLCDIDHWRQEAAHCMEVEHQAQQPHYRAKRQPPQRFFSRLRPLWTPTNTAAFDASSQSSASMGSPTPYSSAQIIAYSPQLDWQLGSCLKLSTSIKHLLTSPAQPTMHTTWVITAIEIVDLYPQQSKLSTHLRLSLSAISQLQAHTTTPPPTYHHLLAADVLAAAADKNGKTQHGYYAIQFDFENKLSATAQPYVPLLIDSYEDDPATKAHTDHLASQQKKPTGTMHTGANTAYNHQHRSIASSQTQLSAGTRVLIKMLDGDLTRPVIIGAVHNTLHPNPVGSAKQEQSIAKAYDHSCWHISNTASSTSCAMYSAQQQQAIRLQNSAKNHLSILNQSGSIWQYAGSYNNQSKNLSLQAKQKLQLACEENIECSSTAGNIHIEAENLIKEAGEDIKLSSEQSISYQAKLITWHNKKNLDLLTQHKAIAFSTEAGNISITSQKKQQWQAQHSLTIKVAGSSINMDSTQLNMQAPKIAFKAGLILVSGAVI